ALHVGGARALRDAVVHERPCLERAVLLEDRVQVTDQQEVPAARARACRDEVAAAVRHRGLDVADIEAERLKARGKDVVYTTLPGCVQRAAVDVDDLLEERDGLPLVGGDRLDDATLRGVQLLGA